MGSIRYYLSERFRLRFEDTNLDDTMDEEAEVTLKTDQLCANGKISEDEGTGADSTPNGHATPAKVESVADIENLMLNGTVRTLDGEPAGVKFEGDAINYQILLGKIDSLLDRLKLDA